MREALAILRRRWLSIVLVPLLALAAAVAYVLLTPAKYEATAQVLISTSSLASDLTGTEDPLSSADSDRTMATQHSLAESETVARAALRAAGTPDRSVKSFLRAAQVDEVPLANVLSFSVSDRNRGQARRLATEWAKQFSRYRRTLDTASIEQALSGVNEQIARLQGDQDSSSRRLDAELTRQAQQLRTLATLQTSNARVVQAAEQAEQVAPQPVRSLVLFAVVGVLIGLFLAGLRELTDPKVSSLDEVEGILGVPLLGRLPAPAKKEDALVTRTGATGQLAEAVRALRAAVEIALLDSSLKTILVTSALPSEGKSSTAANLAVTLARTGRDVILTDFDFRRPRLDVLFETGPRVGAMEVLLGRLDLDEALVDIDITIDQPGAVPNDQSGRLRLLTSGEPVTVSDEVFSSSAFTKLIERLGNADLVICDTPPMIGMGDVSAMSRSASAVLLVSKRGLRDRRALRECRRLLQQMHTRCIGFAATNEPGNTAYAYRYASYTHEPRRLSDTPETNEG